MKIIIQILLFTASLMFESAWSALPATTNFTTKQRYRFDYKIEIPGMDANIDSTSFNLWVPYPKEDRVQKIIKFEVAAELEHKITTENKFGNKMVYFQGKRSSKPIVVWLTYIIERLPHYGTKKSLSKDNLNDFLLPSKMIPINNTITQLASKVAGDEQDRSKIISKFYQYIVTNMKYDKSGTGWGNGDAIWACNSKRGNCTDFHSLFIGMAHSKEIPARFEMGVPIHPAKRKAVVPGYHCWSEVYDHSRGWLPIDASEANKQGKSSDFFGKLPSDRIHFTRGRDIVLSPPQAGEPLNFFIYPYAEENGKILTGVNHTFHYEIL